MESQNITRGDLDVTLNLILKRCHKVVNGRRCNFHFQRNGSVDNVVTVPLCLLEKHASLYFISCRSCLEKLAIGYKCINK